MRTTRSECESTATQDKGLDWGTLEQETTVRELLVQEPRFEGDREVDGSMRRRSERNDNAVFMCTKSTCTWPWLNVQESLPSHAAISHRYRFFSFKIFRFLILTTTYSNIYAHRVTHNSSIQNIPGIPYDVKAIYKTILEISQKNVLDLAAPLQPPSTWPDQYYAILRSLYILIQMNLEVRVLRSYFW